jgi:hypothetical protein
MNKFNYAGQTHTYDDLTIFLLELSRYDNQYKVKKQILDLNEAIKEYESHEVAEGYKKRFSMMNNGIKTIIAKQITLKRKDRTK